MTAPTPPVPPAELVAAEIEAARLGAADRLDAIAARESRAASAWDSHDDPATWIQHLKASADDVPALVAALRAVEALHKRMPADRLGGPHCHTDGLDWPCATVAAITAALDAS